MTKRPRYSQEFKDAIVALYQEGRCSLSLSIEYGMASTTVIKWVHGSQKQIIAGETYTTDEMKKMKKENDRLKEENDILKRAAVLLAKN